MKKNHEKLKNEVVAGFRTNKGVCAVRLYEPINYVDIACEVIQRFITANVNDKVFVVVDCFNTRKDVLDNLKSKKVNTQNVTVLSEDYIKPAYSYIYRLTVMIGVNDSLELITKLKNEAHFSLCIITKNLTNMDFNIGIGKLYSFIDTTVTAEEVGEANVYSPVKEFRIGVDLAEDNAIEYEKRSDFITTSMIIFGDMSAIEKCRIGDPRLNISAAEYRNSIARDNGWNESLNMSIELNQRIDEIYNPNLLLERANTVMNIAKQRRDLCSDNPEKLDVITEIVREHQDKKILIISKRGEFAALVTKRLNSNGFKCVDYHNCIEDAHDVDAKGNLVLVKSGVNKGTPKVLGSQALSTRNLKKFNSGQANILSIKNSSNNKIDCKVDVVIVTSALCDNIFDIKKRFYNVKITTVPNIVYRLFVPLTIEHDKMDKIEINPLYEVINEYKNNDADVQNFDNIVL